MKATLKTRAPYGCNYRVLMKLYGRESGSGSDNEIADWQLSKLCGDLQPCVCDRRSW